MRDLRRDRRYDSPAWRLVRKQVLARDGYRCQLGLPGCTGVARQVDHIAEPAVGGAFFAMFNLRASCGHCNVSKRNRMRARAARERLGEE